MRAISELSLEANAYDFSPHISFSSWIHASRSLLREANIYYAEGIDPERTYILYLRYADLVLLKLRKHPDFNQNKAAYKKAASQVPEAIERSEELKKKLEARPKPQPKSKLPAKSSAKVGNKDITYSLEQELEMYADDNTEVPEIDLENLSLSEPVLPIASKAQTKKVPEYSLPSSHVAESSLRYRQPQWSPVLSPLVLSTDKKKSSSMRPKSNPNSEIQATSSQYPEIRNVHTLENGSPLRTVFVPSQLRHEFLKFASANTRANLETCGILCGKLSRNAFFVTDLIIPHQTSTSDSCTTTNEEELFEYVDKRDLFIVGWIHTHPTQTCFMSSVDLHTHASYQLMLPEAVAIVCAPNSNPDWGAFRLTDPPGIDVIKGCKLSGFHQHEPGDNLYKQARPGGHYREIEYGLVSNDLRS